MHHGSNCGADGRAVYTCDRATVHAKTVNWWKSWVNPWSPMADSMEATFLFGLVTARSKAAEARKMTAAVKALLKPL